MRPKKRSQGGSISQRVGSIRIFGETLAPLMEGPIPEGQNEVIKSESSWSSVRYWMKEHLEKGAVSLARKKRSDPRLLLGVLGCPLAPIAVSPEPLPHLSIKNIPLEASSAQYIVQQYVAASGGAKIQSSIRNSYTTGKVKMFTSQVETASKVSRVQTKSAENGWFVLWQMTPDRWYVELAVEENTVQAGSNGKLVWRYTPWLGAHAAKGPVRPLRRILQGLDPTVTASMFVKARCIGEKTIGDEDCFVLKLAADPSTLADRSDGPAEIIRHVLFGYFSQRTGLLVHLEDSHLTRIQAAGADAVYWETTIESSLKDYRVVDGVMVAHAGHSVVTLLRFGDEAMNQSKTRMEEIWNIEEVVFNVPGLSPDCFIPPADIRRPHSKEFRRVSHEVIESTIAHETCL